MNSDLAPFQLFETSPGSWSLMLTDQHFGAVADVFEAAGGEGGGYDWESIAMALVARDAPHLAGRFGTDPEAGMFVAHGPDVEALTELGERLRDAYQDREVLSGLAAIAEWD